MVEQKDTVKIEQLEDMERFLGTRVLGMVYLYLTKPVMEQFGMEGEKAIRKGLRALGKRRGERQRKWHEEEGLPRNIESQSNFWDILSHRSCGVINADRLVTPYYSNYYATRCPGMHDVCKEANFEHYGYMYCDEMHLEAAMAYHPKIILEIHENLMKGDAVCHFMKMMPPEIPEDKIDKSPLIALQNRIKENPIEFTRLMLKREPHVVGLLYYFISKEVIERFGKDGRAIVKSALIEMGKKRGSELKERLQKAELETKWENIWDHFDLAYKYAWKITRKDTSDDRAFVAEVEDCPLAEVWNELNDRELGPMYCDTVYRAMFQELNARTEIKISQCIAKGASTCKFEFRI